MKLNQKHKGEQNTFAIMEMYEYINEGRKKIF